MGYERFCLGEFQLEFISQELSKLLLDLFCFRPWASKAQEKVVGVPYIFETPEVWVGGVHCRELLVLLSPPFCFLFSSFLFGFVGSLREVLVLTIPTGCATRFKQTSREAVAALNGEAVILCHTERVNHS